MARMAPMVMIRSRSFGSSRFKTKTCARDKSAEFSSKDGFSVVAPTSTSASATMIWTCLAMMPPLSAP